MQNTKLKAFPNPFAENMVVRLEGSGLKIKDKRIQIYDIEGRLVEETDSSVIGKKLKSGVYFVKVKGCLTADGQVKPIKVVKLK